MTSDDPGVDARRTAAARGDTAASGTGRAGAPRRGVRGLMGGNVLWLSLISLLNDTASEMIFPLLPVFLVQGLGAGPAFLGLIEGVADSTSSAVKLVGGWLSDRLRRRKALVGWGYALAAAARPLMAIVQAPWQVLAIRFGDRVGKGVRTAPRDALLAGSVDAGRRGTAFGLHRAADHAGAVVGPLLAAGLLLLMPGRLRLVFALAAIPGIAAVLLVLRVREVVPAPAQAGAARRTGGLARFVADLRRLGPTFGRYLAVLLLFTLGNASDAFLLLRAGELGVPVAAVPLLWGLHHVSKSAWSVPGGALADRIGARRTIVAGWLVYAIAYAGFAAADAAWHAWALFVFYGLFFGLTEAPEKALVAALAPAPLRGAAFGAYHFAVGLGALPASLVFGALWQRFGASVAFTLGAGLALAAAALLALAVPRPPAPESENEGS